VRPASNQSSPRSTVPMATPRCLSRRRSSEQGHDGVSKRDPPPVQSGVCDVRHDERAQGAVIALVLGEDERGELERLRQEVAALRATATPRPRRRIRWASVAAAVLLVLGCVGVPASVVAVWTHNQVADADRFVATMSPVILDPACTPPRRSQVDRGTAHLATAPGSSTNSSGGHPGRGRSHGSRLSSLAARYGAAIHQPGEIPERASAGEPLPRVGFGVGVSWRRQRYPGRIRTVPRSRRRSTR
jgi:hypothetical protein